MKKEEMINILFDEFERDKKTIKENLIKFMDEVVLETKDENCTLTLIVKYERKLTDEAKNS